MALVVRMHGLEALVAKLDGPRLVARPARRFFDRSTIAVQGEARQRAPVDRGRLRNSIATEVDRSQIPRWGRIGTNLEYSIYVHEGTRPHFPPPSAIEPWARRHGFGPGGGFLVARAIAQRGTQARPFLRDGFEASVGQIQGFVAVMASDIEREAAI